VAVVNGYVSLADLKEVVGDDSPIDDSRYEAAIGAASRQIDSWLDPAGSRHFWKTTSAASRVFYPLNRYLLLPGFIANTTGLVVKSDDNGDGVFETTWAAGTDYQAQRLKVADGPYARLVAVGTKGFPLNGRRQSVEVTTSEWGCDVVPDRGRQAAQTLAIALYKSKDFTGGDVGFNQTENLAGWSIYDLARSLIEDYQLNPTPRRASA
jgi:hypothetical protein